MPIYAYKCTSCGHAEDVMRKISDAPLTTCTQCGKDTFQKQLTAPGFQLKGSGWYATDFKGGNKSAPATQANPATPANADAKSGDAKPGDAKSGNKTESKPAPAAAPASGPSPASTD